MPMQVLKTDYKGSGKWAAVAAALNKIGRVVNGMVGVAGILIEDAGEETIEVYDCALINQVSVTTVVREGELH